MDLGIWNADRIYPGTGISGTVYAGHQGKTTDICNAAGILRVGTVFRIRPHGTQYHGTDDAGPGCVYRGFLRKHIYTGKYLCGMIVAVLVTSILLNVSYQYSYEKNYLPEFEEKNQALEKLQSGPDKAILSMDDSAVTRYDQYKTGSYVNTAMYMGTNSTSYYFSVANGNISRFFDEMYLNTPGIIITAAWTDGVSWTVLPR